MSRIFLGVDILKHCDFTLCQSSTAAASISKPLAHLLTKQPTFAMQLAKMSQSCKISLASVYNVAKGYPVEFDKNKSLGSIQMYFFLLARDFRTHLSSMASLDSLPDLFPFADLFCRCLFCNCHFHLRFKFRLKFIFISISVAFR